MPKDATKNIDRYKIRGGQLNEFDFHRNQEEFAAQENTEASNLIPGTPPEVRAKRLQPAAKKTQKQSTKKPAKATKAAKATTKKSAKPKKAAKTTKTKKSTKATKGTKSTKTTKKKAPTGASAKKLAARKAAKK